MTLSDADFERIEARDARAHRRRRAVRARGRHASTEALERFRAEAPGLQGRADRGPGSERRPRPPTARPSRSTPTARSPTCAAARTRRAPSGSRRSSCSRSPAPTGAATPPTRCSRACTGRRSSPSKDLEEYLERLERARANDHRRLGPQLGLFAFSEVAPGSAFWFPAGTEVFNSLVALSREMGRERGYTEVKTPQLYDSSLWKTSGHWDKYRDNMFVTESEDRAMALKPMNCPGHCQLYSLQRHSYRDLPVRYSEPGLLHRNEPSGTLHGLLRVRHFAQDDAHIFCTEDQIQDEVAGVPGVRVRHLRRVRARRAPRALDPARAADRLRRAVGPQRGGAAQRARDTGARLRPQRGRRRLLRPEDRHAHDRLARPLVAARHRAARLQLPGALRASPTPAPTTPSTGR